MKHHFSMSILFSVTINPDLVFCDDHILVLFSVKDEDEDISGGVVYAYMISRMDQKIWDQFYDLCSGLIHCLLKRRSQNEFLFSFHLPLSLDNVSIFTVT